MQIVLSYISPPMIPGRKGGCSKLLLGQPFVDPCTKFDGSFMSYNGNEKYLSCWGNQLNMKRCNIDIQKNSTYKNTYNKKTAT